MNGKLQARWLNLDPTSPGALTADVIPYDDTLSIKEAIDSRGGLGVTEMLQYEFLLDSLPYLKCFFDTFMNTDNVDASNTNATYNTENTSYDGVSGSQLQTVDILDVAGTTGPYYSFYFVVRANDDSLLNCYYSIDNGTTWAEVDNNSKVTIENGFSSLILRFSYLGTASIYSYGVFYDQAQNSYTSDVQSFEYMTVTEDHTAPWQCTLPNNMVYTKDGKSLEVYLNRVRLANGYDFDETDNKSITFKIDIKTGDTILFTQKYGVVDNSIENQKRLDYEHNEIGQHIFKDLATGKLYRLVVINGAISLIPA